MKILMLLILLTSTLFSQKLWEIELDKNIIQVELMPDGEHFIVNYGITGENKKDMKVEVRKLIDGSIEKQILTDEFRNAYIESNTEIYFTQDFKYFMLKWSNILFDVETLKPVRTFEAILDWNGESIDVGKVQYSNDNEYVFILNRGDFDGEPDAPYFTTARSSVYIFDFQTGEFIKKIFLPYLTENIEISDDGKYLQTFQGLYHYGQYANQPVAINIISTGSLEIIKTFEPGIHYNSSGFINNKNIYYYSIYNEKQYYFYDLIGNEVIFKSNFNIDPKYFTSNLLFNKTGNNFIIMFKDLNLPSKTNFYKISYPSFQIVDSIFDFNITLQYLLRIDENTLFSFSKSEKWLHYYDFNSLKAVIFESSEYFNIQNNKVLFNTNDLINKKVRVSVFDNNGLKIQTIFEDILINNNLEFDLPILSNGIYHILCESENKTINYKFMVVR